MLQSAHARYWVKAILGQVSNESMLPIWASECRTDYKDKAARAFQILEMVQIESVTSPAASSSERLVMTH